MKKKGFLFIVIVYLFAIPVQAQQKIKISGVYPHLAIYNPKEQDSPCPKGDGQECGIGAIVPWAGKLWMVSYAGFCPHGSSDKLWVIDKH